jgi:hypothetical protein
MAKLSEYRGYQKQNNKYGRLDKNRIRKVYYN